MYGCLLAGNPVKEFVSAVKNNSIMMVEFLAIMVALVIVSVIVQKIIMKRNGDNSKIFNTRAVALIGIFGAIAGVLMALEFPIFFIPTDFKMEFGDLAALIAGFAYGPAAAVFVEIIKEFVKLLIRPTSTAFVGEVGNFCIGCMFVLPATIFYWMKKTKKRAIASAVIGWLCMIFAGAVVNRFFLVPSLVKMFIGGDYNALFEGAAKFNPLITDINSYVLFTSVPINIIKGGADTLIVILIYKPLSPYLKGTNKKKVKG